MTDPILPADLRELMDIADRVPGASAEAWRERAHANHVLESWRVWLPALLDRVEAATGDTKPHADVLHDGGPAC